MSRRLPPLNSIRAFEAVARLRSFKKAAEELSVTQSAVSHQITALEEWLGLELFRRDGRRVAPTEPALAYLAAVSASFDGLDAATRRLLMTDPRRGWLTVAMLPSFASKWLLPRLSGFRARHPEIDVWIATWGEEMLDFSKSEADVAIRYGPGGWDGVHAAKFMTEELFPVCSPNLLQGTHPLRVPSDLKFHTLLHDEMREDWRMWLAAAHVDDVDPDRGSGFDDSSLAIQAAIAGMGVALGRSVLVREDLEAGRLVRPFDLKLPAEYAYYVVCRAGTEELPKIAAFRTWLTEMAAKDAASAFTGSASRAKPTGG